MMAKNIILSDSITLIKSIEFAFNNEVEFLSADSVCYLENEFSSNNIKLLIADIDIDGLDPANVMSCLERMGNQETSLIFLASEQTLLDLNKNIDLFPSSSQGANWLIKPYSKNALMVAVKNCSKL